MRIHAFIFATSAFGQLISFCSIIERLDDELSSHNPVYNTGLDTFLIVVLTVIRIKLF